ncbi:MAG: hypothetical protein ACHQT8_06550 [Chlamydiales bacterium]
MHRNKQIGSFRAIFFLLLSTLVISGSGYFAIQQLFKKRGVAKKSKSNTITRIVQTGPKKEAIRTAYLAELLNLSQDRPVSTLHFKSMKAEELLLRSPVIKTAEVKVADPETLYIAYTVREPVAKLYDIENSALDEDGYLFPLSPFFAPKILPEIFLGLPQVKNLHWKVRIDHPNFKMGVELLRLLASAPYRDLFLVKRLDISQASHPSFGKREIVLLIEERFQKKTPVQVFLRLTPKNTLQELSNYLELRKELARMEETRKEIVVDLRIPQLGFVK